jgi:phage terminase small subunit
LFALGVFLLCRKEGETMTDKQRRFCDEYLIDCNATRAYKAAYPTVKGDTVASANASRLLGNANIKAYLDEKMQEISSEKVATAEEVIEYLTSVMRGKSKSEVVVIEGSGMGVSEARSIEKTPDEKERLKAAELLGKRYGIFSEKINVEGSLPVMIVGEDNLEE